MNHNWKPIRLLSRRWCVACGLLELRNAVSQRAARASCPGPCRAWVVRE